MELQHIHETVCKYFNIQYEHKKHDNRRNRELILIRQFTTYFARKHTKLSFFTIGAFYNKDHSNTILGLQRIEGLIEFDKMYKKDAENIENLLRPDYGKSDIFNNFNRLQRIIILINKVDLFLSIENNSQYLSILEKRKQRLINLYLKSQLC